MALGKVRGLHPDFFSDDDLAEVSIPARLLFTGLWCFACDNGHLADKSKQIKRWVYATDDVNVAELLRELTDVGVIERADGWITVTNLGKRQRIDWRYFKTCERDGCAKPKKDETPDSQPKTLRGHAGTRRAPAGTTRAPVGDGDGDGVVDGDGDDTKPTPLVTATAATTKAAAKRATQRPADFRPSDAHVALAAELGIDLRAEWPKFCDYCDANAKTYKDWSAALRNWIRNARSWGTSRPTAGSTRQQADADMFERMAARAAATEARGEIA